MRSNYLLLFILLFVSGNICVAQDPRFSQYFNMPLFTNPALTGKFDGKIRTGLIHRRQWVFIPNAYLTTGASFEYSFKKINVPSQNITSDEDMPSSKSFAIGAIYLQDKSGDGALTYQYGGISGCASVALDKERNWTAGIGFQAVTSGFRVDVSKLTFGSQISPSGFDPSIPSGVNFNIGNRSANNFNMNAGFVITGSTNGYNNFYLGASGFNLLKKNISLLNDTWIQNQRFCVHGGGTFPINLELAFRPSFLYQVQQQTRAREILVGGAFVWNTNNEAVIDNDDINPINVYLGAWYRPGDAIYPYAGLDLANGLHLGFTYDFNISNLKAASNLRGGPELSITYTFRKVKPYCPPSSGYRPNDMGKYEQRRVFWNRFN
jgi:type IX secretion system PorP/SprF family membrane protein